MLNFCERLKVASLVSTGWQYECIMIRAVVLFAFVAILPYSSDAQSDDCTIIDTSEERKGCRQLPEIPNGNVIYILTDPQEEPVVDGCYERDTFARNKCDEGFRVTGPSSRACSGVFVDNELISVSWVPDDPVTCVPVCDNLLPIANGSIAYEPKSAPRFVNTTATYTCDPGFRFVNGNQTRTCAEMTNGTQIIADWNGTEGECFAPQCPPLELLENGGITYRNDTIPDYDPGTEALHICNPGFVLIGVEIRICENTTEAWSEEPPVCQPVCPVIVPGVGIATITYSNSDRIVGTEAIHTCLEGLVPHFDLMRTCTGDANTAEWNLPEETCRPICDDLPPIANGSITYIRNSVPREVGTNATYACDPGFRFINGDQMRTCAEISNSTHIIDADWSGEEGECLALCPRLDPLDNGGITYREDTIPDYDPGTEALHICNFGFVLIGVEIRICENITQEWSEEPPVCQPIECEMLPPLENGEITYAVDMMADFQLQTMATHTCNAGYVRNGPEVRICTPGAGNSTMGVWSERAPTCEPQCFPLAPFENGNINYSMERNPNYDPGTEATHSCNFGFCLIGNETRICQRTREWSGEPPVCQPMECLPLPSLDDGFITYAVDTTANFELQTMATYICDFGFFLVGTEVRTCGVGSELSCEGVWSGSAPTCRPMGCPLLTPILNGMISYANDTSPDFEIGTEATYECDTNYCLNGVDNRICDFPGEWSEEAPFCELVTCEDLPVLFNGMVTYSSDSSNSRPVGTVATFSCNQPFSLTGDKFRTCELQFDDNGRPCEWDWSGIQPSCTTNKVNDTATGDPLMTVPLYITNTENIVGPGENDIVNLCFELHGTSDAYFNLVSDACVSVNAHYEEVLPSIPQEDINIIDSIHVRAVDDGSVCHNIDVSLDGCSASVDGTGIDNMYRSQGISVRRFRNRVRIGVPNCQNIDLVMWVFCLNNTFWSTFRVNSDGTELRFQADMIRFVIARGLNLQERSHGLLGQFWNIPIQVEPYTGLLRNGSAVPDGYYTITVNHPNEVRSFTGWLYSLTWEYREEYCLYAGNQQAGPIYEIETPNDPVIEGGYSEYQVTSNHETDFEFSQFDESQCGN